MCWYDFDMHYLLPMKFVCCGVVLLLQSTVVSVLCYIHYVDSLGYYYGVTWENFVLSRLL